VESRRNIHQEASVEILKAREEIYAHIAHVLKPYGLTEPQFNVLRILRGAGTGGLPCLEVGRRLITRVPDVTRLLDRLETAGLVHRRRSNNDRRIVMAYISKAGLNLLKRLDKPINEANREQLGALTNTELEDLTRILRKIS
jgi:DNA-binding MarR family transcriptional regulator